MATTTDAPEGFSLRCEACSGACMKPTTLLSGHTICEACNGEDATLPEAMIRTATPPRAPGGFGWWNTDNTAEQRVLPFGKKQNLILRDLIDRGCFSEAGGEGKITEDDVCCPLCYGVLLDPTILPCGHAFCAPCLVRTFDHAWDSPPTCCMCRENLGGYLYYLNERARAKTRQGGEETAHGGREVPVCKALDDIIKRNFKAEQDARRDEYLHEEGNLGADQDGETPSASPPMSPSPEPPASPVAESANAPRRPAQQPRTRKLPCIPVFVCSVSVPGVKTGLHVFEPRYRLMMRRAIESGNRCFGMHPGGRAKYGCLLRIDKFEQLPDGRSLLECTGVRRYEVDDWGEKDGYATAKVKWVADDALPNEITITPPPAAGVASPKCHQDVNAAADVKGKEPQQDNVDGADASTLTLEEDDDDNTGEEDMREDSAAASGAGNDAATDSAAEEPEEATACVDEGAKQKADVSNSETSNNDSNSTDNAAAKEAEDGADANADGDDAPGAKQKKSSATKAGHKRKRKAKQAPPADTAGRVLYLLETAAAKWRDLDDAIVYGPSGLVSFQSVLVDQFGPPPALLGDKDGMRAAVKELERNNWSLPDDINPISRTLFWVYTTGITTPVDAEGLRFAMRSSDELYYFTYSRDLRTSFKKRVNHMLHQMRNRGARGRHADAGMQGDNNCTVS